MKRDAAISDLQYTAEGIQMVLGRLPNIPLDSTDRTLMFLNDLDMYAHEILQTVDALREQNTCRQEIKNAVRAISSE